jgi:MYXO-CTERM domain-containing protein
MSPTSSSRRPALLATAALSVAVGAAALSPALGTPLAGRAAPAPITFETPAVVDPLQTGGEPDINIDPQGRVFTSAPTGTGTQRSIWYASLDGGHTYRPISPNKPADTITTITAPPGGGDTDIQFDRSGKQYFSDLYALTCFRTATTSDAGATVSSDPQGGCAKTNGSGGDRQWLAVYDPAPGTPKLGAYTGPTPLIYMEYNAYPVGTEWERSSTANDSSAGGPGLQYTDAIAGHPGTVNYSPFGHDGYPSIDQATGDVLEASYASGSASGLSDIKLNIGVPDANGDLTFRDVSNGPGLITAAHDVIDDRGDAANFVVSSIDSGRNLWVAWVVRSTDPKLAQAYVAVAGAASGWTQWSKPIQVSSPAGGSYVSIFPWVKAGGPGRADVVWYGADRYTDPSTDNGQSWDVFMSQVVWPVDGTGGVTTGGSPSVNQVKVTPHPMKYHDVCLIGTLCISQQGNRNLADFFNISIDRSGAAEIVYNDTSNGLAQPGFTPGGQELVDHAGAPVLTVIRQRSGPGLYGTAVSGPSNAPVNSMTHPGGTALFPVIGGTGVPGLDVLGTQVALSGSTLKITNTVVDLSNPTATAQAVNALFLQYVTRWQTGNTIYYAGFSTNPAGQQMFYAGPAQSVDLCSVSGCYPHVVYYPEAGPAAHSETGTVTCPTTPSVATPCTVEIDVAAADVGITASTTVAAHAATATAAPLLEEVGTYTFASLLPQATLNNPQAQADNLPLQVGAVCCFNSNLGTTSSVSSPSPTSTATHNGGGNGNGSGTPPAALPNTSATSPVAGVAAAVALLGLGVAAGIRRRRR